MGGILALAPPDLVDLFLNLERLEVVKLGFVRLELGVELVLAALLVLVALKQDDAAALVAGREVVAGVVKLDAGCPEEIVLVIPALVCGLLCDELSSDDDDDDDDDDGPGGGARWSLRGQPGHVAIASVFHS